MEQQIELMKHKDGQHSLVLWIHSSGIKEYVICSYYDELKPIGERWMWGHYYRDLVEAIDDFKEDVI